MDVGRIVLNTELEDQKFHRPNVIPFPAKKTLVVGFGHKARRGKDTVVQHIIERFGPVNQMFKSFDVRNYSFANSLKIEVFDWLQSLRFAYEQMRDLDFYNEHNFPLPDLKPSYTKLSFIDSNKDKLRPILQRWGTEYRRARDPLYWVTKVVQQIQAERPQIALISDMRFKNEAAICDVTVRVDRIGYKDELQGTFQHASETEMDGHHYDYIIEAMDGEVAWLRADAERVFKRILKDRGYL